MSRRDQDLGSGDTLGERDSEGAGDLGIELVGNRASDVVRLDDLVEYGHGGHQSTAVAPRPVRLLAGVLAVVVRIGVVVPRSLRQPERCDIRVVAVVVGDSGGTADGAGLHDRIDGRR